MPELAVHFRLEGAARSICGRLLPAASIVAGSRGGLVTCLVCRSIRSGAGMPSSTDTLEDTDEAIEVLRLREGPYVGE